jgi:hypothetical protein
MRYVRQATPADIDSINALRLREYRRLRDFDALTDNAIRWWGSPDDVVLGVWDESGWLATMQGNLIGNLAAAEHALGCSVPVGRLTIRRSRLRPYDGSPRSKSPSGAALLSFDVGRLEAQVRPTEQAMKTKKALIDDVRADPRLVSEIRDLLAPSYEDARAVLDRELDNNSDAYLLTNDAGRLDAFFMVGWGRPPQIAGMSAVYLGLSACRQEHKGRGLTIRLYRQFIRDAATWEATHQERLLLWATTAYPLILAVFYRFFDVLAPRPDGVCTDEVSRLAWDLRSQLAGRYRAGPHPLVFRGVATATRYSDGEFARLEASRSQLDHDLFREWEIDERRGDRLLLLGHVRTIDSRRGT